MKVKFWCDSGANIHSCRSEIVDLQKDWRISDEEWKNMTEGNRMQLAEDWANDRLDIGYEEVDLEEDE